MNKSELGQFFKDANGDLWEMITFCEQPTATLRKVGSGQKLGGAVGCMNFNDMVKVADPDGLIRKTLDQVYKNEP